MDLNIVSEKLTKLLGMETGVVSITKGKSSILYQRKESINIKL